MQFLVCMPQCVSVSVIPSSGKAFWKGLNSDPLPVYGQIESPPQYKDIGEDYHSPLLPALRSSTSHHIHTHRFLIEGGCGKQFTWYVSATPKLISQITMMSIITSCFLNALTFSKTEIKTHISPCNMIYVSNLLDLRIKRDMYTSHCLSCLDEVYNNDISENKKRRPSHRSPPPKKTKNTKRWTPSGVPAMVVPSEIPAPHPPCFFSAVLQRALVWHGEWTDEERVMSPAPQTAVTATRASTVTYTLLTALLPSTMSQTIRSQALW